MASTSTSTSCGICEELVARYTCPRCNVSYCTMQCYKSLKHSDCSENFYKELVLENLSDGTDDKRKIKQIDEILSRAYNEERGGDLDSDDDDDVTSLQERLAGIDLDDADKVWERLTTDERLEFESFLRSGNVADLIKPWKPWWESRIESKVVDVDEVEKIKDGCPGIVAIKDFNSITSKSPSDLVRFNLINILAAYAFTSRYFNGEYSDYPREAVACISKLSLVLKSNVNFDCLAEAVESVRMECINVEWIYTDEENVKLMKEDVEKILSGLCVDEEKFYVLSALSDVVTIFKSALKAKGKDSEGFGKAFRESKFPEVEFEPNERIRKHLKKLGYYLSYVKDVMEK